MNPSYYTKWMERAFLHLEGTLLQHSAHSSPSSIREETIRKEFVTGLKNAKFARAEFVVEEKETPWNQSPDIHHLTSTRAKVRNRPRQHDVAIEELNLEAVVEIKWLMHNNSYKDILDDIWKLALTHGMGRPAKKACRTFLLIGGFKDPFQKTMHSLKDQGVHLRWSPQGAIYGMPAPGILKLGDLANSQIGQERLISTINHRDVGHKLGPYHRTPPTVWWNMRCSVIARSWKTIRGHEWKIALFELDYKQAMCGSNHVDWTPLQSLLP